MSLLSLLQGQEYPDISRAVQQRLRQIDLDMTFIGDSLRELTELQDALFAEEQSVRDWPGLSGEFAALLSWLMQDLKSSTSSTEFDRALNVDTLRKLDRLGIVGPYPPELKLKIHHWVVGACWSDAAERASALVFPMRALALDREQFGIAYYGLIRHMQAIEALGLDDDHRKDLEVAVSSIALRIVGLAEALNPEFENRAFAAFGKQLGSKLGKEGIKNPIKVDVEKEWGGMAIEELIQIRNSIAHVSSRPIKTFSNTVESLSLNSIHQISKLASTLIAAEILFRLEDVSDTRVKHWLRQFKNQLEHKNLIRLEHGLAVEFRAQLDAKHQRYMETGLPSQLVTPLG